MCSQLEHPTYPIMLQHVMLEKKAGVPNHALENVSGLMPKPNNLQRQYVECVKFFAHLSK